MSDKMKRAMTEKEIKVKGKGWLKEVHDEEGNWKDLEGWKAIYAPPPKEKKPSSSSSTEKLAESKAVEMVFQKVQAIISGKLLIIILELASTLLTKAAEIAPPDNDDSKKILSSANAVVLSCRFDNKKKDERKFNYIRRIACNDFTSVAHSLLPDKGPDGMTEDLKELFEQQKSFMREMLLEKVDLLINSADAKIDEKREELGAKVNDAKAQAESVVEAIQDAGGGDKLEEAIGKAETALESAGITPDDVVPDKEAVSKKEHDLVVQFGGMFKELIVSKMDSLDETVFMYIEKFLQLHDKSIKAQKKMAEAKEKPLEEIQREMFEHAEKMYAEAKEKIDEEVKKLFDMLKGMMLRQIPSDEVES